MNQIEVHPYLAQDELRAFNAEHEIATEAWSPIAQGKVLDDPAITAIAERVGQDPAQVVLRWHVQRGDIVFPKSVTRSRIEENFALFDFELVRRRHARDHRAGPRRAHRPRPGHVQLHPRLTVRQATVRAARTIASTVSPSTPRLARLAGPAAPRWPAAARRPGPRGPGRR